jgi:rhodanese-related sulfurtransferase
MERIDMNTLHSRLKSLARDELILDVRTPEEYNAGHVPGSRNIPVDQVTAHAEELRGFKRVFVHCKAGGRAGRASDALAGLGLTNLVCIGGTGMDDWVAAGHPVER